MGSSSIHNFCSGHLPGCLICKQKFPNVLESKVEGVKYLSCIKLGYMYITKLQSGYRLASSGSHKIGVKELQVADHCPNMKLTSGKNVLVIFR